MFSLILDPMSESVDFSMQPEFLTKPGKYKGATEEVQRNTKERFRCHHDI